MTITIREQQQQGYNTAGSLTLTLGSGTLTTDTLVVVHADDFYALSDLTTPTGTAATTWTQKLTYDDGANLGHYKVWTAPVTSAGAQTVVFNNTATADDAERFCGVWVLQSSPTFNTGVGSFDPGGNTSWIATGTTAAGTDDLLFAFWMNSDGGSSGWTLTSYPGAPFSGFTPVTVGTFTTYGGGTEQLTASGATGTRTLATSTAARSASVVFTMQSTAGATPASVATVQAAQPFACF